MHGWMDGRTDGRTDTRMDVWMDTWMHGWTESWLIALVNGWVRGWKEAWTDGWTGQGRPIGPRRGEESPGPGPRSWGEPRLTRKSPPRNRRPPKCVCPVRAHECEASARGQRVLGRAPCPVRRPGLRRGGWKVRGPPDCISLGTPCWPAMCPLAQQLVGRRLWGHQASGSCAPGGGGGRGGAGGQSQCRSPEDHMGTVGVSHPREAEGKERARCPLSLSGVRCAVCGVWWPWAWRRLCVDRRC